MISYSRKRLSLVFPRFMIIFIHEHNKHGDQGIFPTSINCDLSKEDGYWKTLLTVILNNIPLMCTRRILRMFQTKRGKCCWVISKLIFIIISYTCLQAASILNYSTPKINWSMSSRATVIYKQRNCPQWFLDYIYLHKDGIILTATMHVICALTEASEFINIWIYIIFHLLSAIMNKNIWPSATQHMITITIIIPDEQK